MGKAASFPLAPTTAFSSSTPSPASFRDRSRSPARSRVSRLPFRESGCARTDAAGELTAVAVGEIQSDIAASGEVRGEGREMLL